MSQYSGWDHKKAIAEIHTVMAAQQGGFQQLAQGYDAGAQTFQKFADIIADLQAALSDGWQGGGASAATAAFTDAADWSSESAQAAHTASTNTVQLAHTIPQVYAKVQSVGPPVDTSWKASVASASDAVPGGVNPITAPLIAAATVADHKARSDADEQNRKEVAAALEKLDDQSRSAADSAPDWPQAPPNLLAQNSSSVAMGDWSVGSGTGDPSIASPNVGNGNTTTGGGGNHGPGVGTYQSPNGNDDGTGTWVVSGPKGPKGPQFVEPPVCTLTPPPVGPTVSEVPTTPPVDEWQFPPTDTGTPSVPVGSDPGMGGPGGSDGGWSTWDGNLGGSAAASSGGPGTGTAGFVSAPSTTSAAGYLPGGDPTGGFGAGLPGGALSAGGPSAGGGQLAGLGAAGLGLGGAVAGGQGFGGGGSGLPGSGVNTPGGAGMPIKPGGAGTAGETANGRSGGGLRGASGSGLAGGGAPGEPAMGRPGGVSPGGSHGMMPHGANSNRSEEEEHQRADYLQETDDVWGDGTKVSPAVLG